MARAGTQLSTSPCWKRWVPAGMTPMRSFGLRVVLNVGAQLGDRAEADRAVRELCLDRTVGIERVGHPIDHARFDDRRPAGLRLYRGHAPHGRMAAVGR